MSVTKVHDRSELGYLCFRYDVVLLACFEVEDGPFGVLATEFQRLADSEEYDRERVVFAKLDVKEVPECVKEFEICRMATLITFYRREKDQSFWGINPDDWQFIIKEGIKKVQN
ncbi:hypothetical protein NW768_008622 [Fusarium equiseti]|uniref:Uncharacterized protein n=1 Tax=Fusarium equiseti TaxID=61235 RepID=A0ABQ8R4J3_FUSEQ|nr:hypothetical protein NW768_008622 [Fusarium equiseti]